jgi:hypothetical protein
MKAQAGCYVGGTTPRQSEPGPCMPGLDVTVVTDPKLLLLASIAKLDNFSWLLVHILIAHQRS